MYKRQPYDSSNVETRKIGQFFPLRTWIFPPKDLPTQIFQLSCILGITLLYLQFKFLAKRGHTNFEGSKSKVRNVVKIIEKIQNRLEVLKWHEKNSVGQFGCENKFMNFFFPFDPFFPKMGIEILIAKYRQMTPQSTRNRM